MPRFIRQPFFWLAAFAVWCGSLWWLSSRVHHIPPDLNFQFSDKLMHFGYFFGGAGLFAAFLFRLDPERPRWGRIIALAVLVGALVGGVDEWHQSHVPGRKGNDPADFAADVLGALGGALVFRFAHRVIA